MQIPDEWYVHILPGLIIMAAYLPILPANKLREFFEMVKKDVKGSGIVLVVFGVVVGVAAFIVGYSANVLALFVLKPFVLGPMGFTDLPALPSADWTLLYQTGSAPLLQLLRDGQQNMVFCRSMFGASLIFILVYLVSIFLRKERRSFRLLVFVVLALVSYGLYQQWMRQRIGFQRFSEGTLTYFKETLKK